MGKNRPPAKRDLARAARFANVQTYIQSGNLILSSDSTAAAVKSVLENKPESYAGKPVGVIVRTGRKMEAVRNSNPFPDAEPGKVGVLFLGSAPPPDTVETDKGQADEEIVLGHQEVFVHYPSGMGRTKLRLAAADGTVRNLNTVRKLVKLAQGG